MGRIGRLVLAGLLGGIAMYIWSSLAHTVLPLGEVGMREIPNEAPALAALHTAIGDKNGMYYFPGMGLGDHATGAQKSAGMKAYLPKLAANPSGLLIYHAPGAKGMTTSQLVHEALLELAEALILAFLLAQTVIVGLVGRTLFAGGVGLAVAITTNGSYHIWYGFPCDYTLANVTIQLVGYLVAGVVIALTMGKRAA